MGVVIVVADDSSRCLSPAEGWFRSDILVCGAFEPGFMVSSEPAVTVVARVHSEALCTIQKPW
jgi:hypothetical protein